MNRLVEPKIEKWVILVCAYAIWILAYVSISRIIPTLHPWLGMCLGGFLYLGIMYFTLFILDQRGIRNA